MTWMARIFCGCLGIVFQTTFAARLAIYQVRPDLPFVLVVFFSLYLRRRDALVMAWIMGLMVDLSSLERLGLMAMAYLLSAAAVSAARESVFLRSAATHFAVTLAAALLLQTLLCAYRLVMYPGVGWPTVTAEGVGTAVYTALCAIPTLHLLVRLPRVFGLSGPRSPRRWKSVTRAAHV